MSDIATVRAPHVSILSRGNEECSGAPFMRARQHANEWERKIFGGIVP